MLTVCVSMSSYGGVGELTATHLLGNHDNSGCLGCSPETRDGKQLYEASEHVSVLCQAALLQELVFVHQLSVDEVHISRGL